MPTINIECSLNLNLSAAFMNAPGAGIIHRPRLVQMQAMADVAVVYHRESDVTQQMCRDSACPKGKNCR